MSYTIIAAIGKNRELGKDNDLIWRLKADMKFFRETTMGHPIVMGRKTFESLPKVLPGRKNIVLSSNEIQNNEIELYKNIKEFLLNYKDYEGEIYKIGGASIYKEFIDMADKLYLTEIEAEEKEADVYFPNFNKNDWNKRIISEHEYKKIKYKHILYKRK